MLNVLFNALRKMKTPACSWPVEGTSSTVKHLIFMPLQRWINQVAFQGRRWADLVRSEESMILEEDQTDPVCGWWRRIRELNISSDRPRLFQVITFEAVKQQREALMPSFQELARLYRGAAVPSSGQNFKVKLQYGQCNSQANEGSRHIRETDISSFQLNTFILTLNNSPERNGICFYVPHHLLLQLLVCWTSKKQGFVSARYLWYITNLIQNIYFSSKKSVKD